MGLCMTIASVLNLMMIARITGAGVGVFKLVAVFAVIAVPAVLLGYFLFGLVTHVWPLIISLAIAGGASVGVVLLLSIMFKVVDLKEFKLARKTSSAA
jgi:hypothetical protein